MRKTFTPLELFLDKNKIKQTHLMKYLGLSASYVSRLVTGGYPLSEEMLDKLINNDQGWDPSPLIKNEEEKNSDNLLISHDVCMTDNSGINLPVIPTEIIQKEKIDLLDWVHQNQRQVEVMRVDKMIQGCEFVIRVTRDTMYPSVMPGDILFLQKMKPHEKIINGTCYFIDTIPSGGMMGYLQMDGDDFVCFTNDESIKPMTFRSDEVYGVYHIVHYMSNYVHRILNKVNSPAVIDEQVKSLMDRLESSDRRSDRALEEVIKAGERVDRALEEVARAGQRVDRILEMIEKIR